ncbi:MAG: hypothetical protein PVJ67_07165 [Candidatus Pacearchaeota archaeon]|jgi:hypothetical protein
MEDQNQSFFEKSSDQSNEVNQEASKDAHNNSQTSMEDLGQTFTSLVGEGKKYKTPEDLAKGKAEADEFIEQLKRENAEMREDLSEFQKKLDKATSVEEALDSLKRGTEANSQNQESIDPETLAKLIDSRLDSRTQAEKQAANKQIVETELVKRFGEQAKADAFIASKAQELGTSINQMKAMSSENPTMFFKLMGIDINSDESSNKGVPSGGQYNTEAVKQRVNDAGPQHGTWEYYQSIRKNNPKQYYSPAVQNEMFEQRKKLGDAFYKK